MRSINFIPGLVLILGLLSGACASNNSAPTVPSQPDTVSNRYTSSFSHNLWLYREILIDPVTLNTEILPARDVTPHWNILSWLETSPCTDCFKLAGITPKGNGVLQISIEITHPFVNPLFTGFDVRGIVMFEGNQTFPAGGLVTSDCTLGTGELLNADGYTTLFNYSTLGSGPGGLHGYIPGKKSSPTPPDATLNGFKRFESYDISNTRNAFYAGDHVFADYEVDMPDSAFIIGYAVDANWVGPTTTPVTDPINDFPPEANMPEPWKIVVTETPVGEGLTTGGGETVLNIDVYSLYHDQFIATVEAPDLFTGEISTDIITVTNPDHYRMEIILSNDNLAAVGDYDALISVTNQNNPDHPPWIDLISYQIYSLQVNTPGAEKFDPVAVASADPMTQEAGKSVLFSDEGSYDPDGGSIVLFEWDFENNGTYDDTGSSVSHIYTHPGVYDVQLRVTDNESATGILTTPLQITITPPKQDPVAIGLADPLVVDVGQQVHFFDDFSFDPDGGDITLYEWDFENDGTYDMTGADVNYAYDTDGTYMVQFRVTDDEGASDTLDTPITIVVNPVSNDPTWDDPMMDILHAACGTCHVSGSSGGLNMTTYADLMGSGTVNPGNPDSSELYNKIKTGSHYGNLLPDDLDLLYTWILNGAPEN